MAMPIQAAPVDRSNRPMTMQSRTDGISPSQIDPTAILCMICKVFPNFPICKFISCPT